MERIIVPLTVEVDGVRLSGFYAMQSEMVTVWHAYLGSRTQTVRGSLASADVEGMLIELYQARKAQIRAIARVRW
ncbi:MAG: hypothetical protein M3N82_00800 [Pseudomonadota bacterium]|nr:hypothetical protein [Pseudomonadota bacterium]